MFQVSRPDFTCLCFEDLHNLKSARKFETWGRVPSLKALELKPVITAVSFVPCEGRYKVTVRGSNLEFVLRDPKHVLVVHGVSGVTGDNTEIPDVVNTAQLELFVKQPEADRLHVPANNVGAYIQLRTVFGISKALPITSENFYGYSPLTPSQRLYRAFTADLLYAVLLRSYYSARQLYGASSAGSPKVIEPRAILKATPMLQLFLKLVTYSAPLRRAQFELDVLRCISEADVQQLQKDSQSVIEEMVQWITGEVVLEKKKSFWSSAGLRLIPCFATAASYRVAICLGLDL